LSDWLAPVVSFGSPLRSMSLTLPKRSTLSPKQSRWPRISDATVLAPRHAETSTAPLHLPAKLPQSHMHHVVCQAVPKTRRRAWLIRAQATRNATVYLMEQCKTSGIKTHGNYPRRALGAPQLSDSCACSADFTRHMLGLAGGREAEQQRLDVRNSAWEVTWDHVETGTYPWMIA
jgi:hypothetical protein